LGSADAAQLLDHCLDLLTLRKCLLVGQDFEQDASRTVTAAGPLQGKGVVILKGRVRWRHR